MEIECTVKELKELISKETPVAGTTDVNIKLDGKKIISSLEKYQNYRTTNCGRLEGSRKL